MIQLGADEYIPSPRFDLVFKSMFTQKTRESRAALMDFLSSVIGREVTDVTIQENEPPVTSVVEKQSVMDLNCLFNDGDQANVEIQLHRHGNMAPRSEYYLCKLHCAQALKGDKYQELHYTYQITILDYTMLPADRPYLNEYELRDNEGRSLDGSRTRLYYLELTKLRALLEKPSDELTRPEKWALFFKYVDDEKERSKINEIIREEEGLEMASKMLEQMAKDSAMRVTLISMEKAERDRKNDLLEARDEGRLEGRQEGRLDMIRSMAAEGIPFDIIAKTAKISVDEIKKIIQ